MFASVQMHYKAPNPGILISGDSLLTMARGQFVPVVENNVIQMRPVHVGRDLGTQVYITAGLQDGDLIVLNPNDAVRQGVRVRTQTAPAGQQGGDADPAREERVTIRVARINRMEHRARKGACSIELVSRQSAVRRLSHFAFRFTVSGVFVCIASAQQPAQTPPAAAALCVRARTFIFAIFASADA